jgi:hypothetical protein
MRSVIIVAVVDSLRFGGASPDYLDPDGKRWRFCGKGADEAHAYFRKYPERMPVRVEWEPVRADFVDPHYEDVKATWMGYDATAPLPLATPPRYTFHPLPNEGPQPD